MYDLTENIERVKNDAQRLLDEIPAGEDFAEAGKLVGIIKYLDAALKLADGANL